MEIKNRKRQYPNDWRLIALDSSHRELSTTGTLYRLYHEEGVVVESGTALSQKNFSKMPVGLETIWEGKAEVDQAISVAVPDNCIKKIPSQHNSIFLFTVELENMDNANEKNYVTAIGNGYIKGQNLDTTAVMHNVYVESYFDSIEITYVTCGNQLLDVTLKKQEALYKKMRLVSIQAFLMN